MNFYLATVMGLERKAYLVSVFEAMESPGANFCPVFIFSIRTFHISKALAYLRDMKSELWNLVYYTPIPRIQLTPYKSMKYPKQPNISGCHRIISTITIYINCLFQVCFHGQLLWLTISGNK